MQRRHSGGDLPLPPTVRPKCQSQLPAYLRDFDVQPVGQQRSTVQSDVVNTAQYAQGQEDRHQKKNEEGARRVTPLSSRTTSPISQRSDYMTLDEWHAAQETQASENKQYVIQPGAQMVAPLGPDQRQTHGHMAGHEMQGAHAVFYSRPGEALHSEQPAQSPYADRIPSFHQLPFVEALASAPKPYLHPSATSAFQPLPPRASTPVLRSHSAPLPSIPPCNSHPLDISPAAAACRTQSNPVDPAAQPANLREQLMMDTITRMMSELQAIKDQTRSALPRHLPAPTQYPSQQPYGSNPSQDYVRDHYAFTSQPYAYGYPQPPVASMYPPRPSDPFRPTNLTQSYAPPNPQPTYVPFPTTYGTPAQKPLAFLSERTYRGPIPTIPDFSKPDPSEFTRLKIALENLLPPDATELFRYQVLLDHLKLEEARLVADAYLNSPTPYSDTMAALTDKFGRPQKLALKKIATVMNAPDIRQGDTLAFQKFALQVRALVGMLQTLGTEGAVELQCGSHVERLLSKLPSDLRSEFRRSMCRRPRTGYDLTDFSDWLQYEAWCQDSESQTSLKE